MVFQGFEKIDRAGRLESAPEAGPSQEGEQRGNQKLVPTNQQSKKPDHQGARIEARSARRNHSSLSVAYEA